MRTDKEKAAEQAQIAINYQKGTDWKRGKRDGVVVTPTQVVDYINRSVSDVLKSLTLQGTSLADPRVVVMDPFGGTGIFLARLIQVAPLTPTEKADLIGRCRMIELDEDAARIARENLAAVCLEETGQHVRPIVIQADTFLLGDEVWDMQEEPAA